MHENEKKSSGVGGRLLLALGVLGFIIALAFIFLAASAFRASSAPTNHPHVPRGHEKTMPTKP